MSKVLLAVDVGATMGWAMWDGDERTSGSLSIGRTNKGGTGRKFLDFYNLLTGIIADEGITHVVYERPIKFMSAAANSSIFGYIAILELLCEQARIPYLPVHPETLKVHATGRGHKRGTDKKKIMVDAATAKWPEQVITSHDQADALWLLDYGIPWAFEGKEPPARAKNVKKKRSA